MRHQHRKIPHIKSWWRTKRSVQLGWAAANNRTNVKPKRTVNE